MWAGQCYYRHVLNSKSGPDQDIIWEKWESVPNVHDPTVFENKTSSQFGMLQSETFMHYIYLESWKSENELGKNWEWCNNRWQLQSLKKHECLCTMNLSNLPIVSDTNSQQSYIVFSTYKQNSNTKTNKKQTLQCIGLTYTYKGEMWTEVRVCLT